MGKALRAMEVVKDWRVNSDQVDRLVHDPLFVADELIETSNMGDKAVTSLALQVAALTDVGLIRGHNEDSWLVESPVYVVADGMGGHDAGDLASRAVVQAFAGLAENPRVTLADMDQCVQIACDAVGLLETRDRGAPGSTVVSAVATEQDGIPFWLIANVGDSRAYLWRSGSLEQISKDHSVVQELMDAGKIDELEARRHPERHVITRAIGALEDSMAEYVMLPIEVGTRLLLCSDGLTTEVPDDVIGGVLAATNDPGSAVRELVETALSRGGRDNVTIVLIDVVGDLLPEVETLRGVSSVSDDTVRTRFA